MKISIVIYDLSVKGGTQKQVLKLAEYLKKNNIEYEIVAYIYNRDKTYLNFKNLNIKYLRVDKKNFGNYFDKLKFKFKKIIELIKFYFLIDKRSDILNLHDSRVQYIALLDSVFGKKSKIVSQINDMPNSFKEGVASTLNKKGKKIDFNFFRRLKEKLYSKFVDKYTVNVTKNAKLIKKHYNKKAEVLYCGIESLEKNSEIREKISKDDLKIVSTGVWLPYRRYEIVIEAINDLIKNQDYNLKYYIIGSILDKNYHNEVKELIYKLNLEKDILILGEISQKKLIQTYKKSDLFIFANENQSWGLSIFEAMSIGLPSIISKSVGATEILTSNQVYILNDVSKSKIKEAITFLVNNNDKAYKLSREGIEFSRKFTWDESYNKPLFEIFERI